VACCSIISAEEALPSGSKGSLLCWSSQASYIVAFGYVIFSFLYFFRNSCVGATQQVLYLISTYRVLPDPWFAVLNASLVYVSVRNPHFPRPKCFLMMGVCHGQGLYPTVIIIFVVLQKSPTHTITKQHASMHFSDRPYHTAAAEMPMRIPMSIIRSPPEETHNTDSDLTALPSPSSLHLRDNKQLVRIGSLAS
jgi:hypothetical protein